MALTACDLEKFFSFDRTVEMQSTHAFRLMCERRAYRS